jgi:hypothetical protein
MKEQSLLGLGSGPLFEALTSVISKRHESIVYFVVLQLIANIFPSGVTILLVNYEKCQSLVKALV